MVNYSIRKVPAGSNGLGVLPNIGLSNQFKRAVFNGQSKNRCSLWQDNSETMPRPEVLYETAMGITR